MLNETHRNKALQQWYGSNNQNIPLTEEALNNESKKPDKNHNIKKQVTVMGDFVVNNINDMVVEIK